jgi:hypothetical protein
MPRYMSRAQVLARSAKAGVALVATGSLAGAPAGSAAADTVPDADLAYAPNEAEHLSVFTRLSGTDPVGISFPASSTIDEASDALDSFSS